MTNSTRRRGVTQSDVARAAGVSQAMVSYVVNANTNVTMPDETRQRILAAIKTLDYKPNLAARSLRTDRTNVIGVLVDNITSPLTPPLVRGIQDALIPHNYGCLIANTDQKAEVEVSAIDSLLQQPVDGIVFTEYMHQVQNEHLEKVGKPSVFVHRLFQNQPPNSVAVDDFGGARLAVRHLATLGHTQIGYISGNPAWYSSTERARGWRAEMHELGLPIDERWTGGSDWGMKDGYAAMQKMLGLIEPPTAILAANDFIALGAIYAVQDAGFTVPGDIAVVGYDNRELTRFVRPRITSVELPLYEMGRIAAEMLYKQIVTGVAPTEEVHVLGKLYIRDSCGAAADLRLPPGD